MTVRARTSLDGSSQSSESTKGSAGSVKDPKQAMKLAGALVGLAVGGFLIYWFAIREPAPAKVFNQPAAASGSTQTPVTDGKSKQAPLAVDGSGASPNRSKGPQRFNPDAK